MVRDDLEGVVLEVGPEVLNGPDDRLQLQLECRLFLLVLPESPGCVSDDSVVAVVLLQQNGPEAARVGVVAHGRVRGERERQVGVGEHDDRPGEERAPERVEGQRRRRRHGARSPRVRVGEQGR